MEITVREICGKIQKHWYQPEYESDEWRPLHIHKFYDSWSRLGSVHFSLEGSPPKGYAIYAVGHCDLHLYDAWGRRWRRITSCHITDLDDFKDLDILEKGFKSG